VRTKTCVITGASRGIGLATALRFAKAGSAIVAVARHASDLDRAAEQIRAAGGKCEAIAADIAVPAEARRVIERAVQRFDRVDVLVNNAGCAPLATIEQLEPAEFDRIVALNMGAIYQTTRTVWPVMKRQGGGVIVNLSSVASVDPFPGFAVYGASKAWVNLFSQAMAVEGKRHGIRVFSVAPGAVETDLLRSSFPDFPVEATIPPDVVAGVVVSVCDEAMTFCSGQTFFVRK
jgi:NAD(P)-dependent dehydrogenase (short-subunit alcohol dehydrogenase family)